MNLQMWSSISSIVGNCVVTISLVVTFYEIIKSKKEQQREVASKVFIWWDKEQNIRKKTNTNIFQISNRSDEPVHNVIIDIEYGYDHEKNENLPLLIGILPPGDFLIHYDFHIEESMHKKTIPVVYFVDSVNRNWKRDYNGSLIKQDSDISKDPQKVPIPQTALTLIRVK